MGTKIIVEKNIDIPTRDGCVLRRIVSNFRELLEQANIAFRTFKAVDCLRNTVEHCEKADRPRNFKNAFKRRRNCGKSYIAVSLQGLLQAREQTKHP